VIREKTGRQDDGASDVDGRCGGRFHGVDVDIEGGHPLGGRIGAGEETREKKRMNTH
jgi:hypothetical protein